jgi:predicted Zn finger-like uncharacterized protein
MVFSCENCGAQYKISDEKVTGNGVRVKCKKCGSTIVVRPAAAPATPPAPPPPEPVAAPKPPAPPPTEEAKTPEERPAQVAGDAGVFSGLLQHSGVPKEPPAQPAPPPPVDEQEADREQTRVFSMDDIARISGERVKAFSESAQPSGPSYFQTFNAPAPQQPFVPEPAAPPKPRGEWYVAIGAVQVGPLTLPEVEERWQKGEINSGTLVWKPGFPDWLQLAGIPELEHLKPKEAPPELPPVVPAPVAQAAKEEPAAPVEEPAPKADTFSLDDLVKTSSVVPDEGPAVEAEPEWKPSAGSALASLVEEEKETIKKVREEPLPVPPMPVEAMAEAGLPPAAVPMSFPGSAQAAQPFPASPYTPPGRHLPPSVARQAEGKKKSWLPVAAVIVVVVAVAAGAVYKFAAPQAVTPPPPPPPPVVAKVEEKKPEPPPVAEPKKVEEPGQKEPEAKTEEPAEKKPDRKLTPEEQERRRQAVEEARKKREEEKKRKDEEKLAKLEEKKKVEEPAQKAEEPPKKAAKRECDPVLDPDCGGGGGGRAAQQQEPPPPPPKKASSLPDTLEQSQVLEVVKANFPRIQSCMKQQAEKDPSLTGKMIVSWEIQPNGRPSKVKVDTEKFQGTFVASCITGTVEGFIFPKFGGDPIPIRFPFNLKGQ